MFSINCLEITVTRKIWEDKSFQKQNRAIYKNLLSNADFEILEKEDISVNKRFLFNDYYIIRDGNQETNPNRVLLENFFGKRINIQAIVGKNGSGKSTLMDLMYMIINNFCYMFERGNKRKRPGAAELYFVPGLYSSLYFSCSNSLYKLCCTNKTVTLHKNSKTKPIFKASLHNYGCKYEQEEKDAYKKNYEDFEIKELAKNFFYSIVSNYSMQSFIDNNYLRKIYFHADKNDISQKINDEKFSDYDCLSSNEVSWISPIFHKNDGYIRSIVLNPYRNNGKINLSNEFELSKDRTASLFLSIDTVDIPQRHFFRPYKFSHLLIKKNTKKIENYLFDFFHENETFDLKRPRLSDGLILQFVKSVDDEFAKAIKEHFYLPSFDPNQNYEAYENYCYCIAYIKVKLFKIIKKYPSYESFKHDLVIEYTFNSASITCKGNRIHDLLDFVISNPSHITKKIRRTVNFLSLDNGILKEKIDKKEFGNKFNNESVFFHKDSHSSEEPIELRPAVPANFLSPQLDDDCLPPPLFDWELILNKIDEKGNVVVSEDTKPVEIPYNQLSSGEIQFLQTISIHAYHLMNLISVSNEKKRPKYRNFNLVFDELEICFHPEMQRQFINHLIIVLRDLNLPEDCFINIFIITHSPFILSDIPASNILYLKDGQTYNYAKNKTFGANISDLCKDAFFLETGFIGDFAKEKTNSLANFLTSKKKNTKMWNKDNARCFIKNVIGEPIVRQCLSSMFTIKYGEDL